MVIRTDTYGGYVWNPSAASLGATGTWQQVINADSMPPHFEAQSSGNSSVEGVWEIQVSWSNPDVLYMVFSDVTWTYPLKQTVYKSTNKGQTWSATGFRPIAFHTDLGGDFAGGNIPVKAWGPKLAIDPTNANVVYLGTGQNGVFYTTNGGTGWTNISRSEIPYATRYESSGVYPGYTILIGIYGSTQYVFVFSYGNGVYLTSDGGGGWSNISRGGPAVVQTVCFDSNTGYFYCVDALGNAWQFTASARSPGWSKIYSGGKAQDIACDPNNANHLIISDGFGHLAESTNSSPSFDSFTTKTRASPSTTGDVAWMNLFEGCNAHRICFSPTSANTIYGASDRDFLVATWTGNLSSRTNLGWQSQARGIEQLVGNCVTIAKSGVPLLGFWDSGLFVQNNLAAYPLASASYPNSASVQMCSSIDFASSDLNFIAALVDNGGGINGSEADISAYSTNGGTSWTKFPAVPPNSGNAGTIAISTPRNMIFSPGNGNQPYYTTDFGNHATWIGCTLPSGQVSWSNFVANTIFGGRYVAADRVSANTFYLFFPGSGGGSLYRSTDSGATWSNIATFSTIIGAGAHLKTTPGVAADFWFAPGNTTLYHFYGEKLVKIANVVRCQAFGFGKNSGSSYPSLFMVGYVGSYPGTYGVYRSDDASTGTFPTWTQIGPWPCNSFDNIRDISGDPEIYEQCYIAFTGSGFAYLKAI
jgi:hypothetical protein